MDLKSLMICSINLAKANESHNSIGMGLNPFLLSKIIAKAIRPADFERVLIYWQIRKVIFEEEQQGLERLAYADFITKANESHNSIGMGLNPFLLSKIIAKAIRSVDFERVMMHWQIRKVIFEEEQQGL